MASLGSLIVRVAADIGLFDKSMTRAAHIAQRRMATVHSAITRAVGVLAGGAASAGFAALIKQQIDVADKAGKVAQQLGISTEAWSGYAFGAKQAGVENETLSRSLGFLADNMSEVAKGATNEAAIALRALGLDVKDADGNLRSVGDLLPEIAQKFSQAEDSAAKVDIAKALFGKEGQQLIPLLNQGADGLDKMRAEAERLGIVVGGPMSAASEQFNDTLGLISGRFQGVAMQIAQGLLPHLQALAQEFISGANDGQKFQATGETIGRVLRFVGKVAVGVWAQIKALGVGIVSLATAAQAALSLDWDGALQAFEQGKADLEAIAQEAADRIAALSVEAEAKATDAARVEAEKRKGIKLDESLFAAKAQIEASKAVEKANAEQIKKQSEFAVQAQRNIQGITASLIKGEHTAKSFGQAVVQALADIAAELLAAQILKGIFGTKGESGQWGGGLISGFLNWAAGGSGKASGGLLGAGMVSEVNERGTEMLSVGGRDFLLMGSQAGSITPASAISAGGGGGSVRIVQNIDARGADPQSAANIMRAVTAGNQRMKAELYEELRRGYAPVGAR